MDDSQDSRNDVRSFVTYRLARVQAKLNAQASAVLKANSDLSLTEWRLLSLVVGASKTTAASIAREVQMDKAQISRAVKSLADRGLIETLLDAEDNRQTILRPTEPGQEMFQRLVQIMQRRQDWLSQGIGPQDLQSFFSVLHSLEQASVKRDF